MHPTPRVLVVCSALALAACSAFSDDEKPKPAAPSTDPGSGWKPLFNGKDLDGWRIRNTASLPAGTPPGTKPKKIPPGPNGWSVKNGVLVNTPKSSDLDTVEEFYNFELHAEFRVPKGSNSGIYMRGKYEIQITDAFGKPPDPSECGALYKRVAPRVNASKAPGEWQTFDITFEGRKLKVLQNGQPILDVPDAGGHGTGAQSGAEDGPGPIRLQGDHGPVEFRNLRIKTRR